MRKATFTINGKSVTASEKPAMIALGQTLGATLRFETTKGFSSYNVNVSDDGLGSKTVFQTGIEGSNSKKENILVINATNNTKNTGTKTDTALLRFGVASTNKNNKVIAVDFTLVVSETGETFMGYRQLAQNEKFVDVAAQFENNTETFQQYVAQVAGKTTVNA